MSRVLVLGGARSGKSAHAESLVEGRADVTYLATSPLSHDDADWAERVAARASCCVAGRSWSTASPPGSRR
jgi:adenosylcobinamide kinase/adenosylcobinamide-phosphate guanylyltransferase